MPNKDYPRTNKEEEILEMIYKEYIIKMKQYNQTQKTYKTK